MKLWTTTIIIALLCSTAGFALVSDFNGTYKKMPTYMDPWCGKKIEIQKIRYNRFRISWELITGERSVVELSGKVEGDTLDFRNRKGDNLYGYTYSLLNGKNTLEVVLTVPERKVVCRFSRDVKQTPFN